MSGDFFYTPNADYGTYNYFRVLSDFKVEWTDSDIQAIEYLYGFASYDYPITIGLVKDIIASNTGYSENFGIIYNGYGTNKVTDYRLIMDEKNFIYASSGGLYFDWSGASTVATFYGGNYGDLLVGGNANDVLYGRSGNDTLTGNAGSDFLFGEDGNDTLNGRADADIFDAGNGNDTLIGGSGADNLIGGTGADTFKGTVDELSYDTIADFSVGDTLIVTDGNLSAFNGQAASFLLTLPNGKTMGLTGPISGKVWSATYSATKGTTLTLTTGPVTTYSVTENSTTGTTVGTVSTAQTSSSAQAKVAAGAEAESVASLIHTLVDDAGGRFAIHRSTGEITVRNGLLLDHEQDQSHTIRVRVTDSDGHSDVKKFTVVVANEDPENVGGDAGDNTLVGGDLNDALRGGRGNDILKGGEGSDTLRGDAGNDRLHGGEDADTFVFTSGTGRDRVADFRASDGDELDFSALGYASVRALLADALQKGEHVKFVLDTGDKVILSNVDLNMLRENQDLLLI
ncbi:MAG TPA: calcium-binding protein [Microvirga sp.]|jgi:Ca2+-binding RTX toxin-like protein|nr:calcium-binding protein [Microvirga sp.]